MASVTIGMPVYGRPELLSLALQSLITQTFTDFELVLSDDASPDPRVRAVCEDFAARDRRVKYVRLSRNIGASANHLHVFGLATSPFFHWASEDDLYEPEFLERGVRALAAAPTKSVWICEIDVVNREGATYLILPPFKRFESTLDRRRDLRRFLFEPECLGKSLLFHGLFRREALATMIPLFGDLDKRWGFDNLLVYGFLCRYECLADTSQLFHKRANTDKGLRLRRWPRRHIYPFSKAPEYLSGYQLAAAGTIYASMTRLLLPLRFALDQFFGAVTLIPGTVDDLFQYLARRWRGER